MRLTKKTSPAAVAKVPAKQFQVWVAVGSWHDGDTFHGVMDQAVGVFRGDSLTVLPDGTVLINTIRYRCALINAPEMSTPAGAAALAYAQRLVPPGLYPCTTYKGTDTYGRPLVDLHLPDGRLFSDAMLAAKQAVPYA